MNNEFRKITIIALSQDYVFKKYKMNTGAFVCCNAPVHFYDLWAPHKYQNQLKISVRSCDTAHQCVYVRLRTSAFVRRMGTAQIPIPIINISVFVWYGAPMRFYKSMYRCIETTYWHRTNPKTNWYGPIHCITNTAPGVVLYLDVPVQEPSTTLGPPSR